MKNKILAGIAIISVLAGCTLAGNAVNGTDKERGYININTSANAEVVPDIAEISFAIVTSDTSSMQKATEANKEASDKVYALLKSMINTSNGDYIKTSDFNAQPVYIYTKDNKKKLDRYEVSNRVTVHTKSTDKIGAMIDKSIASGATNVNSLNFSVSNYESQCNSLIEIASKKASTRASIAVKTMGTALDGIKSMDISCTENSSYRQPRVYMAKNMLAATAEGLSDSAGAAISEGVIKIYANVNASFFVK